MPAFGRRSLFFERGSENFEFGSSADKVWTMSRLLLLLLFAVSGLAAAEDCRLTPVVHVLQSPGCVPKKIPSFACVGKCTSYVQVSGSKMWQTERSCMCCQESGEREATVMLTCEGGSYEQRQQKVVTKAPVDCMCRPCTAILDEGSVMAQEMVGLMDVDGQAPPASLALISRRL